MREGSTLIREKVPSTHGCIWQERELNTEEHSVYLAFHTVVFTVLGLVAAFLIAPFMPDVIVYAAVYAFAVVNQALIFARHWIYTRTDALTTPGLILRLRLTAGLRRAVVLFPATAIRGARCVLAYPGDALRAWSSYLSEGEDVLTRVGLFYFTGACAGALVLRSPLLPLASALGAGDVALLFVAAAPFALCLIVPVLLTAPYFPELPRRAPLSRFERAVALKNSPNPTEAQSIPLGRLLDNGTTIMAHIVNFLKNALVLGIPGSGKTTILCYLAELFGSREHCNLHYFDAKNKNSMEVFEAVRIGAKRGGLTFLFFTTDPFKASHTFNLFKQKFWAKLTAAQKASFIGAALGSTHGLAGYGPQYFGGNAWTMLYLCFKHYAINTWHELLEKLDHIYKNPELYGMPKPVAKSATEVLADVLRMTAIPQLNTPESSIDLDPGNPTAVYWEFPSLYDQAGAVIRLIVFALFDTMDNAVQKRRTWVFIDEAARVMSGRMDVILQQSREKCGLILALQEFADLNTREKDYRPLVQSCTNIHWRFNVSDQREQLFMSEVSGKVTRVKQTTTYTKDLGGPYGSTSESFTEYEANRYGFNEMSIVNADPRTSIIRFTQDQGFIQYGGFDQLIFHEPHISWEEHLQRKSAQWPPESPGTITPGIPEPLGPPQPRLLKPLKDPEIINPESQRLSRRERRRRKPQ